MSMIIHLSVRHPEPSHFINGNRLMWGCRFSPETVWPIVDKSVSLIPVLYPCPALLSEAKQLCLGVQLLVKFWKHYTIDAMQLIQVLHNTVLRDYGTLIYLNWANLEFDFHLLFLMICILKYPSTQNNDFSTISLVLLSDFWLLYTK